MSLGCRGGVGAFEAESHAAEVILKADELFNNDQVPAFQTQPAAESSEPAQRKGGRVKRSHGVGLEVQKHLAWSAMHLLFYLEIECRQMAKAVGQAEVLGGGGAAKTRMGSMGQFGASLMWCKLVPCSCQTVHRYEGEITDGLRWITDG